MNSSTAARNGERVGLLWILEHYREVVTPEDGEEYWRTIPAQPMPHSGSPSGRAGGYNQAGAGRRPPRPQLMRNLLIASVVLMLQTPAYAVPPDGNFLPVSVWYAGGKARAPMLEPVTPASPVVWRQDLVRIKSLGFNTVRTWVEWTAGEPREDEYHLEPLDLVLKLAEEVGLKVIVQTYVDSAPDWVGVKYPDGHFVAQNGQAIPSQAAPGFCFDNPGVRRATLDFLKEVARHAAKSRAFHGWDLWSEPHIINWAEINYIPNASFCYCPHSMARFRQWLQAKYSDIPNLNRAWYRQFQDWKEVEPPRFDTILS